MTQSGHCHRILEEAATDRHMNIATNLIQIKVGTRG
jgi:hypothetical protein